MNDQDDVLNRTGTAGTVWPAFATAALTGGALELEPELLHAATQDTQWRETRIAKEGPHLPIVVRRAQSSAFRA